MTDAVNVIQVTDLHLLAGRALLHGVADTSEALDRAVAHICAIEARLGGIDAVIVTGDLTDLGEPDAYDLIRDALHNLPAPVHVIPGNHDDRATMRAAFGLPGDATDPINFVVDHGPVRLIGLDSSVPSHPWGELDPSSLVALSNALGDPRPSLIAVHHPPVVSGIGHMDIQNLRDAEQLAALVQAAPQDIAFVCGHVHRAMTTKFAGRLLTVSPAPCHAVRLDLRPGASSEFDLEPGGVTLHRWHPAMGWASHVILLGPCPGPFPFPTG